MDSRVMDAAKAIIIIALAFNLVMIGISAGLGLLGYGAGAMAKGKNQASATVGIVGAALTMLANWGVSIATLAGNVVIFLYGGYTAAKRGNGLANCGLAGIIAYAVTGIVCGLVSLALSFLGLGAAVVTSGNAFNGIFAGIIGTIGLGVGLVCSLFWFLGGLVANFVLALIGGLIGGAK